MNNTWINHEDDVFLFFECSLLLSNKHYKELVYQLNIKLHELTIKYELLMLLTKEYCESNNLDIIENYKKYLTNVQGTLSLFQKDGYEFHKKDINRISKMFYKNKKGELEGKYVHYLVNGLYGIPEVIENKLNMESTTFLEKYSYMDEPIRLIVNNAISVNNNEVKLGFIIESHCSIWMDKTPNFRFMNKNGNIEFFEYSDNREIAYKNTPRLNSFLRDIKELIKEYGGTSSLYDYESYLAANNNPNSKIESSKRKGLKLDGKICYQEDLS